MTVHELAKRIRQRLDDAVGKSTGNAGYTDEELIDDYANVSLNRMYQVVRRFAIDSTTPVDSSSVPLCRIPLVAGTATYAISTKILGITRIKLASQVIPLPPKTVDELDGAVGNWQGLPNGTPFCYCTDLNSDSVTFVPPPAVNDTAYVSVCRYPLVSLSYKASSNVVGLPDEYIETLLVGIMAQACDKKDSELYSPAKSVELWEKFEKKTSDIKMELYKKVTPPHGVSMRRGCGTR